MRKEAVFTVLLNVVLFPGMRCVLAQDPRYLRFSLIEDGVTTHYNLRVCYILSCLSEHNQPLLFLIRCQMLKSRKTFWIKSTIPFLVFDQDIAGLPGLTT